MEAQRIAEPRIGAWATATADLRARAASVAAVAASHAAAALAARRAGIRQLLASAAVRKGDTG